jgi:lipoyl(octanoyl) transferase
MTNQWRLILDGDRDGYYNMAADEVLLEAFKRTGEPVFRVYGWDKPFITLGYHQDAGKVFLTEPGFPFTRRITGGAAMMHQREVTYSLVCSQEDLDLPVSVRESYKTICRFLLEFYSRIGLKADFAASVLAGSSLGRYRDFCLATAEHFDIVIDGRKVGGNAQKRSGQVIFQQGTIPVELMHVPGLVRGAQEAKTNAADLKFFLGYSPSLDFIKRLLAESFSRTFGVEFKEQPFDLEEKASCLRTVQGKYKNRNWNLFRKYA